MNSLTMRPGGPADVATVLELWDKAIRWLVARGQLGQWGEEPVSSRPAAVEHVRQWAREPGLTLALLGEEVVGVSVLTGACPPYVPAVEVPETYLMFLVTDRDHAGQGIGSELVKGAARDARASGSKLLRVDCWAGAPSLVAWYERQGFAKTTMFEVGDGWRGQVFEMELQ